MIRAFAIALLAFVSIDPCSADPALDALVVAYPEHFAGHDNRDLIFKDGTRLKINDGVAGKNFEQMLDTPDIKDQFVIPYPLGAPTKTPAVNEDPGRIRNEALFVKMYGDCRKGDVAKKLRPVKWLPARGGGTVMATTVNGVAEQLAKVSADLEKLPLDMMPFLMPSSGTYNCRTIAGTKRLSVHAYGAAIDLNAKFGDYWQWTKPKDGKLTWKNRIPLAIVEVFERHDFIWGGKWYHFDSFHFEYRPEMIALAKQGWPRK